MSDAGGVQAHMTQDSGIATDAGGVQDPLYLANQGHASGAQEVVCLGNQEHAPGTRCGGAKLKFAAKVVQWPTCLKTPTLRHFVAAAAGGREEMEMHLEQLMQP